MEKTFETLYARDSKGGFKQWSIDVDTIHIRIQSGKVGGKLRDTFNTIQEGKQGRSDMEQAIFEAESKFRHKKKEGYKSLEELNIPSALELLVLIKELDVNLPKDNTDDNGDIRVMKCQPYLKDDGTIRINFPCIAQPKLNGFRCTASVKTTMVGMFPESSIVFKSKHGLKYEVLSHIAESFKAIRNLGTLVLDGEMYIHGEILSEISSAVRKNNPKTAQLKYYVFDLAIPTGTQSERLAILNNLFEGCATIEQTEFTKQIDNLVLVKSKIINDEAEATEYFNKCIEAGYEGAIYRANFPTYKFGQRPQTIVKRKKYIDSEFEILAVIGQEKNPTQALFVCKNDKNDLTFKVMSEGTVETKERYLKDSRNLVGKRATIRYFERTKNELPFHGIIIDIRDYE